MAVLAIPAFLHPSSKGGIALSDTLLFRDYALMLGLTFGLAGMVYFKHLIKKESLGKIVGLALTTIYVVYLYVLYDQSLIV